MSIFIKKDYVNNNKRFLDIIDTLTLEQKTVEFDDSVNMNAINESHRLNDETSVMIPLDSNLSITTGRKIIPKLDIDLKEGFIGKIGNDILLEVFGSEYIIRVISFEDSNLFIVTVNDNVIAEKKLAWVDSMVNLVLHDISIEDNRLMVYFQDKSTSCDLNLYIYIDYNINEVKIHPTDVDVWKNTNLNSWFYNRIIKVFEYCLDYDSPLNTYLSVKNMELFLTVYKPYIKDEYIRILLQLWIRFAEQHGDKSILYGYSYLNNIYKEIMSENYGAKIARLMFLLEDK